MTHRKLAVAVAGALAFPGAALAQSSVSISGYIKMSIENVKLGNFTRAGHNGENRVVDENSRIIFNVVEDLGGGNQAIVQVDLRVTTDVGTDTAGGNNWVG